MNSGVWPALASWNSGLWPAQLPQFLVFTSNFQEFLIQKKKKNSVTLVMSSGS